MSDNATLKERLLTQHWIAPDIDGPLLAERYVDPDCAEAAARIAELELACREFTDHGVALNKRNTELEAELEGVTARWQDCYDSRRVEIAQHEQSKAERDKAIENARSWEGAAHEYEEQVRFAQAQTETVKEERDFHRKAHDSSVERTAQLTKRLSQMEELLHPNKEMVMAAQLALHKMIWPGKEYTQHSWSLPVGSASIVAIIAAAVQVAFNIKENNDGGTTDAQ